MALCQMIANILLGTLLGRYPAVIIGWEIPRSVLCWHFPEQWKCQIHIL